MRAALATAALLMVGAALLLSGDPQPTPMPFFPRAIWMPRALDVLIWHKALWEDCHLRDPWRPTERCPRFI